MSVQAGFMARSLVAMHEPSGHSLIKGRFSSLECGLSGTLVTGLDRSKNFLDAGTHEGSLTGIAQTMFLRLTGTLAC